MRKRPPPKNSSLNRTTITCTKKSRKFPRTKLCTPMNKPKRFLVLLKGGPFDNEKIRHYKFQNHTLVFTLKGETGFYNQTGAWISC